MSGGSLHQSLTAPEAIHPAAFVQSTDPGAVGPYKLWLDSTLGVGAYQLKMRSGDNSQWLQPLPIPKVAIPANVVSPEQFGAFANGVADPTLDEPALLACYNALAALGGGTIEFYHDYAATNPIAVTGDQYSNIALAIKRPGAGAHHTQNTPTNDNTAIISMTGASAYSLQNISVTGLTLTGFGSGDYRKLIAFSNCNEIYVDRMRLRSNGAEGIYFSGQNSCSNVHVTRCDALNVGIGSQSLAAYNVNADLSSLIAFNKALSCGIGIEQDGRNCRIIGNHLELCTVTGMTVLSTWASWLAVDGFTVLSSSDVIATANVIIGCPVGIQVGDATGHLDHSIPVPGNQGALRVSGNNFIRCASLFVGGADSLKELVIVDNYGDDALNANGAAIWVQKGRAIVRGNTFRLGATASWAYLVRMGADDPVNTSGYVGDNRVIGKCWTTSAFVIGPEVTLGPNAFEAVSSAADNYLDLAGSNFGIDGPLSRWTLQTDAWLVQLDPTFCYSQTQPSTMRVHAALPAKGTYKPGDRLANADGVTPWWDGMCTVGGTADTIKSGVTATTTSGSASFTITAGTSKVTKYQWITITGVTGRYQIIAYDPATGLGTLSATAAASVANASVAYSAPTWVTR